MGETWCWFIDTNAAMVARSQYGSHKVRAAAWYLREIIRVVEVIEEYNRHPRSRLCGCIYSADAEFSSAEDLVSGNPKFRM